MTEEEEEDFSVYLRLINNCDPEAPLLSQTPLGARLSQIPVESVQASDLNCLTLALSVEQLIPTESGLARDYRGLAELMGFSLPEIETRFKKSNNSAKSLIEAYVYSNRGSDSGRGSLNSNRFSINDLLKFIEQVERFDVIDDFLPTLVKLASQKQRSLAKREVVHCLNDLSGQQHLQQDIDRLTFDDTLENVTNYDAFICYAPQDMNEAQDLKSELQSRGKSVATAGDLLPGHFEHDALMRLIDLRCRKVIIIVTRNFCHSEECKFQLKFASEVAIKGNDLKIIPVLYETIPPELMPGMIRYTSKINLNDPLMSRAVQFDRLIRSLDYPTMVNTHSLDSRLSQSNRRTSSFNGRLAVESGSASHQTNGHYGGHCSMSNGNSPVLNRTNDPIVELSHSQDSSAIRNHSPSSLNNSGGMVFVDSNDDDNNESASSSKKWLTKIRNTFSSSRKKANHFGSPNASYQDSSSFASHTLLISGDSSDLSTDENIQSRKLSE